MSKPTKMTSENKLVRAINLQSEGKVDEQKPAFRAIIAKPK